MAIPTNLDGMRQLANRWLIGRCTIQRPTETSGEDGVATTWSDVATDVPCSLAPSGNGHESEGPRGGVTAVSTWTIRLPYGTDVAPSDRIVVGSRIFEVGGVNAGRTFEVRRSVSCTEIT